MPAGAVTEVLSADPAQAYLAGEWPDALGGLLERIVGAMLSVASVTTGVCQGLPGHARAWQVLC